MLRRLCFQPLNSFVILIAQSLKIMNATSKEIWRKLCRMWRDFINCCRMWHQWGCRILVFRMFSDRSQILQSDVLFPYGCLQKGGSKSEDYQKTQSAGEIMSISIVFKSQLSAASWSDWLPNPPNVSNLWIFDPSSQPRLSGTLALNSIKEVNAKNGRSIGDYR